MSKKEKKYTKITTEKSDIEITIKPVSSRLLGLALQGVEEEFKAKGKQVDVPRYEAKMVGDEIGLFPLAEDLLFVKGDPQETARRTAIWDEYTKDKAELEEEQARVEVTAMFGLGCEFEMPEDESWQEEVLWVYPEAKIPTEKRSLRAWFLLYSELSEGEIQIITAQFQAANMGATVTAELVDKFRSTIQDTVEREFGNALEQIANAEVEVGSESPIHGSDNSEKVSDQS